MWTIRGGGSTGEKPGDGRRRDRDGAAAAVRIPAMRRGGFARPLWPTGAPAWRGGGGDVWRSRRPMVDGGSPASKCAQAAWHHPRPLARVISRRCTVATAPASNRWVFRRLGVRARSGYGGADVACAQRNVVWVRALARNSFM
jgi:hypothetical protein